MTIYSKKKLYYHHYFLYTAVYLLFYLHSLKTRIVYTIGQKTNLLDNRDPSIDGDYILVYLLIIYIIYSYLEEIRDFFNIEKKKVYLVFYFFLFFSLIVYSQINFVFLYKNYYPYECFFFNDLGALGLILPILFINQIWFFISFLGFFLLSCIYGYFFSTNHILFGLWYDMSNKNLLIFLCLILIHIIGTIILDYFTENDRENHLPINENLEQNIEEELNIDTKHHIKLKELKENRKNNKYIKFSKHIIDKIYGSVANNEQSLEQDLSEKLLYILKTFSINGELYKVLSSYTVTNYFFKPQIGTKMSRIESIEEELSIELQRNVRVTSGLQGVIFEISNEFVKKFSFKDIWEEKPSDMELPLFIGFNTFGEKVVIDLVKQPHILMCGTTGSGKSSTLHCLIHSLTTNLSPENLKFIFIDPKVLELSIYKNLAHLFVDVITDLEKAIEILDKLTLEMEKRYKVLSYNNQRSLKEYNKKMSIENNKEIFPYLVCIIEEFADLALHKNNRFKNSVQRLAQMGRAAGIHLIIATQRPSANVIDGTIKANFPTRIALKVANKLESRIILDYSGAERMSQPGEMILLHGSQSSRVMAPYIGEEEINRLLTTLTSFE